MNATVMSVNRAMTAFSAAFFLAFVESTQIASYDGCNVSVIVMLQLVGSAASLFVCGLEAASWPTRQRFGKTS
ncbi:hypothetical protein AB4Y32_02070 [Paraburkholderia phymatum]|uniref:Uncharacterized protein n=1 Tax=Paraburkholderia phymatum TaxID=148447 RepID=A0ACC6TTD0_9BURK